jgi:hypothetical protein
LKKISFLFLVFAIQSFAQPQFSNISSMPGAFSRLGFGARGIGMGNAMSSVTSGNLVSYYNPAVSSFQENNSFQAGYSFLSLDRNLNFLNFTRRFDFYSINDTASEKTPRSSAGISLGIINSGVSKIDGRDNQGFQTGELSTSENQFFIGLANRFSKHFSLGIAAKFYYFRLYEDMTATNLGMDVGALYRFNDQINFSLMFSDINSKYEWNSGSIYGTRDGIQTVDKFPLLKKIGASYFNKEIGLLAAAELVLSNAQYSVIRFGSELNIFDQLFIRGGVDQVSINNSDWGIKPSAGLSYSGKVGNFVVGFDYAFMIEQYSPMDRHIVGINLIF